MNWRWPETETNYLRPWYGIVVAVVLFPLYLFFRVGLAVVYGAAQLSPQEGYRMWDSTG